MNLPKLFRILSKWFIAFALLPLVWASFYVLAMIAPTLIEDGWKVWWMYILGINIYILIEFIFKKPMWLYVIGHELTHAISGLLSGARVHRFKVSSRGGEVRLSKSNFFIALAPYVVPLYVLLVVAAYAIISHWYRGPTLTYGFQFMIGFTLAFHISLTYAAIHQHQPDLKILGMFLSMTLIAIGNAIVVAILCVALFKNTPTFREYLVTLREEAITAWVVSGRMLMGGILTLVDYLGTTE